MFLNIFALIIILVILSCVIFLVIKLGSLPGNLAQQRKHPQTEAIRICGWIGIFTGGLLWIAALIWAHTTPSNASRADIEKRIEKIEDLLKIQN